jgi:hypothetical protein
MNTFKLLPKLKTESNLTRLFNYDLVDLPSEIIYNTPYTALKLGMNKNNKVIKNNKKGKTQHVKSQSSTSPPRKEHN